MKNPVLSIFFLLPMIAYAAEAPPLTVKVEGLETNHPIPEKFAFCKSDGKGKKTDADDVNPAISWSSAPAGTQSYAVLVVDKDVPASFDNADKDGKTIDVNAPRQDFYHWALVDIPVSTMQIAEGQDSKGYVNGGKEPGKTAYGINGQNDFGAKAGMGKGGGYDGPCPPWNDERLHHYHFRVYALNVPSINVSGNFNGKQAEEAMNSHVLAMGEIVGTYTTNPTVPKQ